MPIWDVFLWWRRSCCPAFASYTEGPLAVHNGAPPWPYAAASLEHLDLPAGSYVIFGKAWFGNDSAAALGNAPVFFGLVAEGVGRQVAMQVQPLVGGNVSALSGAVFMPHTFKAAGRVDLWAYSNSLNALDVKARDVEITAIEVSTVNVQ
jgi:hypothetical protein